MGEIKSIVVSEIHGDLEYEVGERITITDNRLCEEHVVHCIVDTGYDYLVCDETLQILHEIQEEEVVSIEYYS